MQEEGDGATDGESSFPLTPIQGTYVIGLANAISSALPFFYVNRVGRKPVFVIG